MDQILFLGLNGYAWITIAVILGMFSLMMFTRLAADFVFLGGIAVLLVTGVLSDKEAIKGFSDTSVVTIGVLFVVIAGLVHTGVIQIIANKVLGVPRSYPSSIVRLMIPVAFLSSFLSNTTVVALFIKVVNVWSKKLGLTPSKLLIPLSYAAGMGGCLTLIGTPPNLIISGMYTSDTGIALNVFTPTLPALGCFVVGILTILAMRSFLPTRKSPSESFQSTGEYTVEMIVPADNPHIGETVEEAKLKEVPGGHLIEIVRFDGERISPVSDDDLIFGNDRLIYTGQISDLLRLPSSHSLTVATKPVFSLDETKGHTRLRAATVPLGSSLAGRSLCSTSFEDDNDLVVVAITRQGERIDKSPREVVLRHGDTLLLQCPSKSRSLTPNTLSYIESEDTPNIGSKTLFSSLIMLGMVLLSTFGVMSLLQSCFLAALAMLLTRCCNVDSARSSINWSILMVFAGSICLGTAIEKTGIATAFADGIMKVCGTNPIIILVAICFVGTFLTEFISNTAAAAMLYPIAYKSALLVGANPLTFCVALMIAVSSSFATPIGSPTHMLVYGPGGYHFTDFARIGLPMNIIMLAANISLTLLVFPL